MPAVAVSVRQHTDGACIGAYSAHMKWAGMFLVGFVVLIGGVLAALWKMGILERVGTTWTLIGVAIAVGFGIMFSVANSGTKENIEIERK